MTLPEGFLFNQSNLQDYVDCQRRFQLRHVLHQSWPAVEAEPYLENEHLMDLGVKFHKIVHQHLTGVDEVKITQSISMDSVIQKWWRNYLTSTKSGILGMIGGPGNKVYPEITLSIPIGEFRLIAKYDLLIIQPDGKLVIVDWKTSQNHPKRRWLEDRLQTHVYPFVLTGAASGFISGKPPEPDQIEMIYCFTEQPEQPERFRYSVVSYREDNRNLENLIATIHENTEPIFTLTLDVKRCLYCTYRSLCNRGVKPGDLQHLEEWLEPDITNEVTFDFDQIGEIET